MQLRQVVLVDAVELLADLQQSLLSVRIFLGLLGGSLCSGGRIDGATPAASALAAGVEHVQLGTELSNLVLACLDGLGDVVRASRAAPATARAMAARTLVSTRKVAIASSMPAAVLAYMLTAATPAPATTPTPSSASVTGFAASTAASVTMAP